MKVVFFAIATLVASAIASTIEPSVPVANNDTTDVEPDQEICILSIVPCPKRCRDTCIYPDDVPCPKTHPPRCPNEKPKQWPPHQKRSEPTVKNNAAVHEQDNGNQKNSCLDRPCPRVVFRPCPKACPSSCEFQNPADPCCPYSGKPVCMNLG
ncbi:hypothetical protein HMPREF1544_02555 [Mucor circinelloides 1006PhL]|uniref:Uncharacterized protein n=1 Tax=Mucor circinelloides f. circinelloides (strain 1006PhL) TaxID=1220926 RepID=S2KE51_MUCC1|nr:hypothetical protein HMPREF1544_02555 [Mucor circinelloides 1006PhL]KAG1088648.1 hypothetical protein G6F42_020210 [Rhizopus arrhizus]